MTADARGPVGPVTNATAGPPRPTATGGAGWEASLFGTEPSEYQCHGLHGADRVYSETNCYNDIIIELLHARGDEPLAAMGHTLAIDFEGDQWTFFKPLPDELQALFGIDIHEMQPYRPLPDQIAEQIAAGRTLIVELDSWYLPDTAATSYRREHVKSSVIAESIDRDGQRLRYFHAAGLYELSSDDFRAIFRLTDGFSADVLPPYTELVRFDAGPRLTGEALRDRAKGRLRRHLAQRPQSNPFDRFGEQLQADLPRLLAGDSADYHDYAFATVRMAGSAFEVAASHVTWLLGDAGEDIAQSLARIVEGCKALSFRLARRREFDPSEAIGPLAAAWQEAMTRLDDARV